MAAAVAYPELLLIANVFEAAIVSVADFMKTKVTGVVLTIVATIVAEKSWETVVKQGHEARKMAWETQRVSSVLGSISANYSSKAGWDRVNVGGHLMHDLHKSTAIAMMDKINDNVRFRDLRIVLASFKWDDYRVLNPDQFLLVAKRFHPHGEFNHWNMRLTAVVLMYADIVFTHERPAHKLLSVYDYEDDVVPSYYKAGDNWDRHYKNVFDMIPDTVSTNGLPQFYLDWTFVPPGVHLITWPQLHDDLMILAGWPGDVDRLRIRARLGLSSSSSSSG
ncbi:hypothetical protein Drorol1_Dr00014867 [Drosera rotundifolia]